MSNMDYGQVYSPKPLQNKLLPSLDKGLPTPSKLLNGQQKSSRSGLPQFQWTLALLGLCMYTFTIITFKLPLAQLGIAVGMLGLITSRKPLLFPMPVWLYMAFLLWAWVSTFASPFSSVAFSQLIERSKLLVIIVLTVNALRTEEQLRFYLLFVLVCFVLFPVRGTLLGGDTLQGRAVWNFIYTNPNDLAVLCLLALGIAASFVFSEAEWNILRIGALISAMLLLFVILLTQSRGVFLGFVVAIVPAAIPLLIRKFHIAVGIVIVVALVVAFVLPPRVWNRLVGLENLTSTETIAKADPEGSAGERFEIQKTGWHIFLDNPFLGIGLGAYQLANNIYAPKIGKKDTHNTYLNLAAEIGLPGLLIWCSLIFTTLFYVHRARKRSKASALKIQQYWIERTFVGYLVAAVVGTYAHLNFPYIIISILWCASTILAKTSSRTTRPSAEKRI